MAKFYKSKFTPRNPQKYLGDPTNIISRSSWELKCMNHFDTSSNIIAWNQEEIVIPYRSPKDGKFHRYFIDFLIVTNDKDGNRIITLVEVKPKKQTIPPTKQGKKKKNYLYEAMRYAINKAKWEYAEAYCKKKGWNFVIMTEEHIF